MNDEDARRSKGDGDDDYEVEFRAHLEHHQELLQHLVGQAIASVTIGKSHIELRAADGERYYFFGWIDHEHTQLDAEIYLKRMIGQKITKVLVTRDNVLVETEAQPYYFFGPVDRDIVSD